MFCRSSDKIEILETNEKQNTAKENIDNRWEKHIFKLPENKVRVKGSTSDLLSPFKINTQLAHVILAMRKKGWDLVCAVSFKLLICP